MFFVNGIVVQLSLDSGCEGDCIHVDECKPLGIPILPLDYTDTQPMQADGHSPLEILGKVKFTCTRDKIILHFEGYVARNIQAPILCGGSFLSRNKITQDLHNNKIVIDGKYPHSAQTQSQLFKCLTLRTSSSLSTPSQKMSLNKTLTKYLLKTMFLNI